MSLAESPTSMPAILNKDVLDHLTHQLGSEWDRIRLEFPIVESVNIIYANLQDQKDFEALKHDMNYALLVCKSRLPKNSRTLQDYTIAKAVLFASLTRAKGPHRERELVNTTIGEVRNITSDQRKKPAGRGLIGWMRG